MILNLSQFNFFNLQTGDDDDSFWFHKSGRGGGQEFAFLTCAQVIMVPLIGGPHTEGNTDLGHGGLILLQNLSRTL